MEPDGGNLYRPHPLMIHSGQFWRCAHGKTGFGDGMKWIGCKECANDDPNAYRKFHNYPKKQTAPARGLGG